MPRILHCADMHFDSPFSSKCTVSEANIRRTELRESFSNIIERSKKADILLIAGDMFDSNTVSEDTIKFIIRKFSEIPDVKIFISAGNHDPLTMQSPYNLFDWGKNVHIFSTEPEKIELPELNTAVYGVSFSKAYHNQSLLPPSELNSEKTNILLIHGDVIADSGNSDYNPITKTQILQSKFDYIALGHIHKHDGINKLGKTYYAYSGIPEGRGFDEDGAKGIIEGTVEISYSELKFTEICKRQYHHLNINISDLTDTEHIIETIIPKVSASEKDLYKIYLTGDRNPEFYFNIDVITERLKDKFHYIELEDKTKLTYDYKELSKENSLKGIFTKHMLDVIKNSEDEQSSIAQSALKYGLEALSGNGDVFL